MGYVRWGAGCGGHVRWVMQGGGRVWGSHEVDHTRWVM